MTKRLLDVVAALLDDDPAKQGLRIGGVTVIGPLPDLLKPHVLAGATHVIIALPGAAPERHAQPVRAEPSVASSTARL